MAPKTKEAPSQALDVKRQRELRIAEKATRLETIFLDAGIEFETGERDERTSLEAALDIALRLGEAETEEAVFDPGGTVSGKDMVDKPFVVTSVPIARQSTVKGGLPFYFQFNAQVLEPTGELVETIVSVGALNVMTAMAALNRQGKLLGRGLRFQASDDTASGYTALWLRKAPDIAGLAAVAAAGDDEPF